ncbi:MAG: hypothetical protein J2P54_16385, partial [Bradyrhizobiaceae bacterium]|nr:hypothetical protein [Bradyrhizobiaceae bacterium]
MSVNPSCKRKKLGGLLAVSVAALMSAGPVTAQSADSVDNAHAPRTRSPIKHLIYIIGENRSFDNVYGAYQPKPGRTIDNLLSKGIIKADGTPGRHFAQGTQYQVILSEASGKFFLSPSQKIPYQTLPVPTIASAQPEGIGVEFGVVDAHGVPTALFPQGDPELPPEDQFLLATGGTGSIPRNGADTRIPNVFTLAPGPFPQTSPTLPYDSYEGDTVHQLLQMWQQSDCSVTHATRRNPTGCLHDLYPFVATTFGTAPGHIPTDG